MSQDYNSTMNLPKTSFDMRAALPKREPEMLKRWEEKNLYKNMVAAEADWLYDLEEWDAIFDADKRKALYKEQKSSTTIVKGDKIYPNDPCPCGSGKKYKNCCGKKG